MTPADELRQAAATLRRLVSEATPGPWTINRLWPNRAVDESTEASIDGVAVDSEYGDCMLLTDARWIATVSPAIAEPLAAWLEREADVLLSFVDQTDYYISIADDYPPFLLARGINEAVSGD